MMKSNDSKFRSGRAMAFLLMPLFFAAACGPFLGEGDDRDDEQVRGALLLELIGAGCEIGGHYFDAFGELNCNGGIARGTGTLTARSNSREVHSMELIFQMGETGGLEVIGGARAGDAESGTIARGHGFAINAGAARGFGPAVIGINSVGAPGEEVSVWCLEMHLDENDVHLLGVPAPCPHDPTASAAYNSENDLGGAGLGNGPAQGRAWGFILQNATIYRISINPSARYGE